jgi:two-component system, LytTR family, response regulator
MTVRVRPARAEPGDPVHLEEAVRQNGTAPYLKQMMVRVGAEYVPVPADVIEWIGVEGNYVILHTGTAEYRLRTPLSRLLPRLNPADFVRVRRSKLVRIDKIRRIRRWSGTEFEVELASGARLVSSRAFRAQIQSLLVV